MAGTSVSCFRPLPSGWIVKRFDELPVTAENAIVDPSGDQSILLPTPLAGFVSRRTCVAVRAAPRRSPPCPRQAVRRKAMRLPSGENVGVPMSPLTWIVRSPVPSALAISKPPGCAHRIWLPSGDQVGSPFEPRQSHPVQTTAVRVHREDVEVLVVRPLGVVARERDPLAVGRPCRVQRVAVGQVRDLPPTVAVGSDREELGVLADLGLVGEQTVGPAVGRIAGATASASTLSPAPRSAQVRADVRITILLLEWLSLPRSRLGSGRRAQHAASPSPRSVLATMRSAATFARILTWVSPC